MSGVEVVPRCTRSPALNLVDGFVGRIRDGRLAVGGKLPTETGIMAEFGVSRTVVREAISMLQAAGLVETRHGIGTFVLGDADPTAIRLAGADSMAALRNVVAVVELRLGLESEAAVMAAMRRTDAELSALQGRASRFRARDRQRRHGGARHEPAPGDRTRHAQRLFHRADDAARLDPDPTHVPRLRPHRR